MHHDRRGFTLIELSMVLVIIGLIVGGILTGQSLIRAASLRKLASQVESYNTAVNTFKGKYNCLPGDCSNATSFFGLGSNCGSTSYSSPTGTCDGNGNGQLDLTNGNHADEGLWMWQQLSLAHLVQGYYNSSGNPYNAEAGMVYPALPSALNHTYIGSSGPNAGIRAYWNTIPLFAPPMRNHVFVVGLTDQTLTNSHPALSPGEAQQYDAKFDDGTPNSGTVQALLYNSGYQGSLYGTCATGSGTIWAYVVNDTYTYVYPTGGYGCRLFIESGF